MATKNQVDESKEFKVYKDDEVTIEYTEKASFHKKGDKAKVQKYLGQKLEKKGVAKIIG